MIPTWMIKEVERQRRERADRERPHLEIELPVPLHEERWRPPDSRSPIVIELA